MSDEVESTIKMMENYHKKGGDYIIPVEVVNDIKNLIIELEKEKNNIFDTGIKECLRIRDMKDKEIERLNKIIFTLEETIRKANNNVLKDIAMIKTHEMVKQEIVQRLIETSKILESGSDKE